MNINISNSTKAVFSSLSIGEIFMLNETDVCVKIGWGNDYNTWNFKINDIETVYKDTEVTIPRTVNMEVIV
jgi:hypothetical protein